MPPTKTRDALYEAKSLDASHPKGGALHERLADPRGWPGDENDESPNKEEAEIEMLSAVLEASIGLSSCSRLLPPRLNQVFASSITASQTRELLRLVYENGGDRVLNYVFGLEDGRGIAQSSFEPLEPARKLWPSGAYQQNARKLLDRAQSTLRTNFLIAAATYDESLFIDYLFWFGANEGWRKGTVDRLSTWREHLNKHAPEQIDALSELTIPTLKEAGTAINKFLQKPERTKGAVPFFTSVYTALRYVGLFSRQGIDAADILHSDSLKLPRDGSAEAIMLHRALERPLHLLDVREEWDAFISRLLDWLEDSSGTGTVFAAYTACYYLDSLDDQIWQGIVTPLSVEQAWTKKALHTVLEESNKNLNESWYKAPHHTVINTLRALNYLRAHPNPVLGIREVNVCLRLARAGIGKGGKLSHPRVREVRGWFERLERKSFKMARDGDYPLSFKL